MPRTDWTQIDQEWLSSKHAILAYHVGGWRKGDSPLAALARALGTRLEDLPFESFETFNPTNEHNGLDALSECLEMDWGELPELNITESVNLAISLVNEKLRDVPPEVRNFFGAPSALVTPFKQHIPSAPAWFCATSRRMAI